MSVYLRHVTMQLPEVVIPFIDTLMGHRLGYRLG